MIEMEFHLRLKVLVCTLLCVFLSAASVQAKPLDAAQINAVNAAAQKQLNALVSSKKYAGAGFALIDEGHVVLLSANGVRNKAAPNAGGAFGLDTPVQVGSVTRLFAVLSALKLSESGKLDLSRSIDSYLPQLKFASQIPAAQIQPISVRDLLLSSSGITRGSFKDLFVPVGTPQRDVLAQPVWLSRPAGGFSEQSFLADALLGKVLEKASGVDFPSLIQREITGPMKLTATRFKIDGAVAAMHDEGKALPVQVAGIPAALGLHSSVRDLATLVAALDSEAGGISAATRALLTHSQNKSLRYDFSAGGSGQGYVFSFSESVRKQVGLVGFLNSSLTGLEVSIRLFPQHRLAVVAISNGSSEEDTFGELVKTICDAALKEKANVPVRGKQVLHPPPESLNLPAGLVATPVQSAYATPVGLIRTEIEGDRFDFNLAGFGLRAYRRADGWYRLSYRLLGMIPLNLSFIENILIAPVSMPGAGGAKNLMLFSAGSEVGLFGGAIASDSVVGDAGEAWLGAYEIANPDAMSNSAKATDIEVVREKGVLLLRATFDRFINVDIALPLSVTDAKFATLSGVGPGLGEPIMRDAQGTLNFSGYLLRRKD